MGFFFCSPWLRPCMHSSYKFEKEDTYEAMINSIKHKCAPNVKASLTNTNQAQ